MDLLLADFENALRGNDHTTIARIAQTLPAVPSNFLRAAAQAGNAFALDALKQTVPNDALVICAHDLVQRGCSPGQLKGVLERCDIDPLSVPLDHFLATGVKTLVTANCFEHVQVVCQRFVGMSVFVEHCQKWLSAALKKRAWDSAAVLVPHCPHSTLSFVEALLLKHTNLIDLFLATLDTASVVKACSGALYMPGMKKQVREVFTKRPEVLEHVGQFPDKHRAWVEGIAAQTQRRALKNAVKPLSSKGAARKAKM